MWILASFVYLLTITFFGHFSFWTIVFLWVFIVAILTILDTPSFRIPLISKWAYKFAKKQLPSITKTEREALKAGTVSWDGELFSGMPNWKSLFAYEPAKMSKKEQEFLDGPVEAICATKHNMWDMWHKDLNYPKDLLTQVAKHGLFGMIIPKKYGGKEFSVTATWQIGMKLAGRIGPLSYRVTICNSIGAGELVERYGSKKQKDYYLPRLCSGEEVPCFALTSAVAGSDATAIEDSGVVCKGKFEGKEVLGIKLNFNKRYMTLGNEATLMSLAFRLYDPEHLLGKKEDIGITMALVPTKLKGVTHGRRHYPLGQAFPNGPLVGKDVFIPIENIIGGQAGAGKAWEMLTQVLATGRATSLPTGAVGATKFSFYTTTVYCSIRRQFGLPIGKFESVQEKLAEMAGFVYIADATRLLTFAQIQAGERPAIPAAISKYNATEMSRQCAIHAIDLQGGKGVMNGPHNMSADHYASAPMPVTVEGSNTMTRGLIVFGQGAVRCHPYILSEMMSLEDDDLKTFDQHLMGHLNYTLSNHVRSFFLGLTNGRTTSTSAKGMKRYAQKLTRLSAAFSLLADVSMITLGGKLKRMESLSGRFADVFSMLYMGSAAIKHFHDKGYPAELKPVVVWSLQWALNKAEQQLSEIIDNFPNFILRGWLRLFIFPLGRRYKKPNDRLTHHVAALTQSSKTIREVLADGIYLTPTDNNPITQLEEALAHSLEVEPINKRISQALKEGTIKGYNYLEHVADALEKKVITKAEEKTLQKAHKSIMNIINVDDFSVEELHQQK